MSNLIIGRCPVCSGKLKLSRLVCPDCSAEFPADRFLSPYDELSSEDTAFLKTFLICRGNLKEVQASCGISYPTAKKRLDSLLSALGFIDVIEDNKEDMIDMRMFTRVEKDSTQASDIVRNKLYESGGQATVKLFNGDYCTIRANTDGQTFACDKIPQYQYQYRVFDTVVDDLLLHQPGYSARKGNGRYKIGEKNCTKDTVVGAIGTHYFMKSIGESTYDPVFAIAAILEWAGIAHNGRGYVTLTAEYCAKRLG